MQAAIALIAATPGYAAIAEELAKLLAKGRIRVELQMEDRAQTGLTGTITLGSEAIFSSALSLAQTLVHERFHLHQNPLLKTVSFWSGVVMRVPVMRRYERPAYRAAYDFLEAVKSSSPSLCEAALAEQNAIRQVFASCFGSDLME